MTLSALYTRLQDAQERADRLKGKSGYQVALYRLQSVRTAVLRAELSHGLS